MNTRAEELAGKRIRIFARICLVWGVVILFRLIQLQVLDHHEYVRLAQNQQERQVELKPPRGAIFDRNGQPLAMSVAVDSVCINPLRIPDIPVAVDILSAALNLNKDELLGRIAQAAESRRGFLWIKRKVTFEEAARLRSYNFDWIEFRPESTRYYPKDTLAAHVLGGVNHEERGNAGIEQAFDKQLRGKPGLVRTTADVRHNVFDQKIYSDPTPGVDVTLTLDERIQYIAEQELAKAVKEHDASAGSLVAMNPKTGEILALANFPTYDPNTPPETKQAFDARKNLAVTAPFEPGSVFKMVTIAAALEHTRLTPDSLFFCHNGAFTLFRRVIHDAKPHGTLSMANVLAKSSNIGAIKAALAVGNEKLYDFIRSWGFGQSTGLPLPGESGGTLRKLKRWIPSSIGSIAMGHELSTTSVQLARACSVVANGGFLVQPKILMSKEAPVMKPVMKPANAMKMRVMMRGVVEHGTGKTARLRGYSVAGKTGSAQIYDYRARVYTHRYNGSFMGFAPVNNPAIVVVVTLNNTRSGSRGFGGVVAGPVFAKVTAAALRYLDVPRDLPDDPLPEDDPFEPESDLAVADLGQPPELPEELMLDVAAPGETLAASETVPSRDGEEAVVSVGPKTPNFQGKTKREVLSQSVSLGIRVEIAGSGVARAQIPPAGAVMRPGERVRVVFAR